ncbi:hypothetical protein [Acinetobacter baumannii]|uniref:hypothetical protein n=1 Tax=Acinetobacter baumannii TaxID=470 RepID=UPI00111345A9|nr:hypothetical protein [Acinetobacter baumannii]
MTKRLTKQRREMRILALNNAASLVQHFASGGISPEEMGLTKRQWAIFEQENEGLVLTLQGMADQLQEEGEK